MCDICGASFCSVNRDIAKKECCEKIGRIKHKHSVGDVVKINRLVKIGPGYWDNEQMDLEVEITELCWAFRNHKPYYLVKQLTGPLVNTDGLLVIFNEKDIID
jgi:hypothetical protein